MGSGSEDGLQGNTMKPLDIRGTFWRIPYFDRPYRGKYIFFSQFHLISTGNHGPIFPELEETTACTYTSSCAGAAGTIR